MPAIRRSAERRNKPSQEILVNSMGTDMHMSNLSYTTAGFANQGFLFTTTLWVNVWLRGDA